MNLEKVEFYDTVKRAQNGDRNSLLQIINAFEPIIQQIRGQVKTQERDDLSQTVVEGLIFKIMNYRLEQVPSYTEFCKQLIDAECKIDT